MLIQGPPQAPNGADQLNGTDTVKFVCVCSDVCLNALVQGRVQTFDIPNLIGVFIH